jgi:peptidoglycan/LPS O-acetylase OafA/YrhL
VKVKAVMAFAASSFAVFVLASAIATYLAAHAAGNSLQVLCVLSLVATVLLLIGFGLGAVIVRRLPGRTYAAAGGAGGALAFVAALSVASALHANPVESWGLVFLLPVLGAAASLLQRKGSEAA